MEIANIIIAGFALVLAIYSTLRVRKFEKNQNKLVEIELEEKTAKIAESKRAKCDANLVRTGKTDWILKIFNKGQSDAKNVYFNFTSEEGLDLLYSGSKNPFPILILAPQNNIDFHVPIHMGLKESSWTYNIKWDNNDGTTDEKNGELRLPLQ